MTSTTGTSPLTTAGGAARWKAWFVGLALAGLWVWTVAGCLDEWRDNPMYSYGWFVPPLVLFFAWRRLDEPFTGRELLGAPRLPRRPFWIALGAVGLALLAGPTELLRNELPDDRLNNWFLATLTVVATLWVIRCLGGWPLARALAFPVAYFLTAVAWPKRYELPVTVGLQKFVTDVIVEVLHVLGIHADPHGTTIYLKVGPVGIAEACSGVRSLQASLMISLAIGELFFLRWPRRVLLIGVCAGIAMVLNLARTLSLCLITEYHGVEAMEKAHDWIGNTILLVLPMLAWGAGRLLLMGEGGVPAAVLPRKPAADGTPPPRPYLDRVRERWATLDWPRMPNLAPALVLALAGILAYHSRIAYLNRKDPPQQFPFFTAQVDADKGIAEEPVRKDIWAALSPTKGGNYIVTKLDPPGVSARLFHFFWKPDAANRWATGHRPDICMPAGGWVSDGAFETVEVEFQGRKVTMHAFRFQGVGVRAVQLWGMWRNGEALEMDFFGRLGRNGWSLWSGRTHSAVEVVSCVVVHHGDAAPMDVVSRIVADVFRYQPVDARGQPKPDAARSPGNAPQPQP